jgi:hypothetical protein
MNALKVQFSRLFKVVVIFAGLAVAGISMAIGSQITGNAILQSVMVPVGSAIFCAGLVFFLLEVFAIHGDTALEIGSKRSQQ